ncbi:MAG: helix-turn-helix transcriptional regulator [Cytophagales bacterium]|nr:helix-turn-helix transcriptional regulator [Cytophagales bacterium]
MNYFSKNLKALRAENNLSQVEFGLLFGLSKSNINSYENGAFPKLEKFIQMMDYFNLDPSKFVTQDMERSSVSRGDETEGEERSMVHDQFVESGVSTADQFQYLEGYSKEQIAEIYIKLYKTKERLLKENTDLKEKYIELLEKNQKAD